jgi:paraquat-inducible protein B
MSEAPTSHSKEELPTPAVRNRRWIPRLVWVVPIVAAVIGVSLLVRNWENAGPHITVSFLSGEGVQVGKTLVKYRDVTVGRVSAVVLSADHQTVLVSADLSKDAASLVKADTRFWIVRPRIGVGWASGLDTLLSGVYIGMETGGSRRVRVSSSAWRIRPHYRTGRAVASFSYTPRAPVPSRLVRRYIFDSSKSVA